MKNIDHIKKLKAWELAEFLNNVSCGATKFTTCNEECNKCEYSEEFCIFQIAEWLQSEKGE